MIEQLPGVHFARPASGCGHVALVIGGAGVTMIRRSSSPTTSSSIVKRPGSISSGSLSAHSVSVTPSSWRSSTRPPPDRLFGTGESVQVLVEEWQPAGVFGHQREARAIDHIAHTEALSEALRELRLARAERPEQRNPVPSTCRLGERARKVTRLLGGARLDDGALALQRCLGCHRSTLIETGHAAIGRVRTRGISPISLRIIRP